MQLVLAILAVATWYRYPTISEGALYCMDMIPHGPWLAIDAAMMYRGEVLCGDVLVVEFVDFGIVHRIPVYDIGPLVSYGHYIADYADLPHMLDIERGAWPVALDGLLSARVHIHNHSELVRIRERRSIPQ